MVTAAIFAPSPTVIIEKPRNDNDNTDSTSVTELSENKEKLKPFEVLVAADWQGGVKLYINR